MSSSWLVIGAGGQFGSVTLRELVRRGEQAMGVVSPRGPEPLVGETCRADITDRDTTAAAVRALQPDTIIHAAAVTAIDVAFRDPGMARRVNVDATRQIVELASETDARLVLISTDLVFDGRNPPYNEESTSRPLSVYGRTKADAEQVALGFKRALVVRLPLMYGLPAVPRETPFTRLLAELRRGVAVRLFADEIRTAIGLADAAQSVIRAARSDLSGLLHIAGPEPLSRLDMGRIAARALGYPETGIIPSRQADLAFPEPRPADVSLDCRRFVRRFGDQPGRPMAEVMVEIAAELRPR